MCQPDVLTADGGLPSTTDVYAMAGQRVFSKKSPRRGSFAFVRWSFGLVRKGSPFTIYGLCVRPGQHPPAITTFFPTVIPSVALLFLSLFQKAQYPSPNASDLSGFCQSVETTSAEEPRDCEARNFSLGVTLLPLRRLERS